MTSIRSALILSCALVALCIAPALAAETRQYDPIGRLTDVAYQNGGSLHYTYDANGNVLSMVTSIATAVESGQPRFEFALGQALPNPGSGSRSLVFSTPARGRVTLRVFDVSGRQVATLVDGDLNAGPHNLRFFTDRWGNGVYYYRLQMAGRTRSGRLVVLR